jgi:hypothetical protein
MNYGFICFLFVYMLLYKIVVAEFKESVVILYFAFCSGLIQKIHKNMCNNLTFVLSWVF